LTLLRIPFARAALASALVVAPAAHADTDAELSRLRHLAPAAADLQTEHRFRPGDDSLVIAMMNARTHALDEYVRCLDGSAVVTLCVPPRPIQLPPQDDASQDRRRQQEAMIESAARSLKDAEMRAIKAHAECVRNKQAERCGRPP
jgi:hypothetical protein